LPDPVVHRRFVFSLKDHFWLVRDQVFGTGIHQLELFWHIGPEFLPVEPNKTVFRDKDIEFSILAPEGHGWSQELLPHDWSPAYGRKEPCNTLRFHHSVGLPVEFVTLLQAFDGIKQPSECSFVREATPSDESISSYVFKTKGEEHHMMFSQPKPWSFRQWSSDAEFLYWGETENKTRRTLICCNGSYVEANRKRIISSEGTFLRCEVMSSDGSPQFVSSVDDIVVDAEAFSVNCLQAD